MTTPEGSSTCTIRIMCAQDVLRFARAVLARCRRADWKPIWDKLQIGGFTFADFRVTECCEYHRAGRISSWPIALVDCGW